MAERLPGAGLGPFPGVGFSPPTERRAEDDAQLGVTSRVELAGRDWLTFLGARIDDVSAEIAEFVTGQVGPMSIPRSLCAVLFTDLGGSTQLVQAIGCSMAIDHRSPRRNLQQNGRAMGRPRREDHGRRGARHLSVGLRCPARRIGDPRFAGRSRSPGSRRRTCRGCGSARSRHLGHRRQTLRHA